MLLYSALRHMNVIAWRAKASPPPPSPVGPRDHAAAVFVVFLPMLMPLPAMILMPWSHFRFASGVIR